MCDVVSVALQQYTGAPPYRPYWSEAARDRAVARLKAFLRAAGGSLASRRPEHAMQWEPPFDWAWLW